MPDATSYIQYVRYDDPAMGAGYSPIAINHYVDVHTPRPGDYGDDVQITGPSGGIIALTNEGTEDVIINGSGPGWVGAIEGKAFVEGQVRTVNFKLAVNTPSAITIPTAIADFLRQEAWIR